MDPEYRHHISKLSVNGVQRCLEAIKEVDLKTADIDDLRAQIRALLWAQRIGVERSWIAVGMAWIAVGMYWIAIGGGWIAVGKGRIGIMYLTHSVYQRQRRGQKIARCK